MRPASRGAVTHGNAELSGARREAGSEDRPPSTESTHPAPPALPMDRLDKMVARTSACNSARGGEGQGWGETRRLRDSLLSVALNLIPPKIGAETFGTPTLLDSPRRQTKMAEANKQSDEQAGPDNDDTGGVKKERRKIPGNLPYTSSAGVLKSVLERIPDAEKPAVFNIDFLSAVLNANGGSARAIPPILKATGIINQSGNPTELYSQFQTESGRPNAALQALKTGYTEVFKRNQYAHRLDDKGIIDIIVSITGLPRTDTVVRYIISTFKVFQEYAHSAKDESTPEFVSPKEEPEPSKLNIKNDGTSRPGNIGLVYNINIVLPETTNVEVYNAIFRSIRGNLLQ